MKYGGKNVKEIRGEDLKTNLSTLRFFESFVTMSCTIVALFLRREVLAFFALSILPLNLANYFKQLNQATGEFSLYGKIMIKNPRKLILASLCFMPIVFPETAAIILTAGKMEFRIFESVD